MASSRIELLLGIVIGIVIAWLYFLVWRLRYSAAIREDAVQRSLAVTAGKVHEQLVPYLPEFGFNPKDARFLGSPVDLIVFDGLAAGDVRRVVFLEVKTGGAPLNTRERQVRDVIEAREVAWAGTRARRLAAASQGNQHDKQHQRDNADGGPPRVRVPRAAFGRGQSHIHSE